MKALSIRQGSPEWEALRREKIGASDAPVIMGVSPWETPYGLWQQKMGQKTIKINEAMARGQIEEKRARAWLSGHWDIPVVDRVVQHSGYNWAIASLDGVTLDGEIVEIKAPGQKDHGEAVKGRIPPKYIPQLQHQMACAEVEICHYLSWDGHHGLLLTLQRDEAYIKEMFEKEEAFWECMCNQTPPGEEYVFLDDEDFSKLEDEYLQIVETTDLLEKRKNELRGEILSVANGKKIRGKHIVTRKRSGARRLDQKKLSKDVDLENYYIMGDESWVIGVHNQG